MESDENRERLNTYKKLWDDYSLNYMQDMNKSSLGIMSTLMGLSRIYKKNTILDAGCGPGYGTKQITTDVPSLNTTIYAFDFSDEMIKLCGKVFSEYDDFNANKQNHYEVINDEPINERINIVTDTKEIRKSKIGKVVKFFRGNVDYLNFEDEQFDVYISNLCLFLSNDVDKAISESYRVLKNNGVAAISIWGKKDETYLAWKIFSQVLVKYGVNSTSGRSSFWLAEDEVALREKFIKAGYRDVRFQYTNEIYDCFNEQDYLVKFQGPGVNSMLQNIKDDQIVHNILEDVKNEAKKELIENCNIPNLNCLVILAFK